MSEADIYFEEAREKGELAKYLGGYPEYALDNRNANLPTDAGHAITPFQNRAKVEPNLGHELSEALMELALDDEYGWQAISYLRFIPSIEEISGKDLLGGNLVSTIADRLRDRKKTFSNLRKWQGTELQNGVWGLVQSYNYILHTQHHITVLPEEL